MKQNVSTSKRNLRTIMFVIIVCALALTYLEVWTAPDGLFWHLLHGRNTSFEGIDIPVPWDMFVLHLSGGDLTIIRRPARYAMLRMPAGMTMIVRGRGPKTDFSLYYDRIAHANEQPMRGYKLQGRRQFAGAKGTVYCWELDSLDATAVSISCDFDNDTLSASYIGSPVYRDYFYQIVAIVSKTRS